MVSHAAVSGLFKFPDDPAAAAFGIGDLGPRRGPRRPRKTAFGKPSTFALTPGQLRRERTRRSAEGWQGWEIKARFADLEPAVPRWGCGGEFVGEDGTWREHCPAVAP